MTEADKRMATTLDGWGFPYTAEYIRRYGIDAWNPQFIYGFNEEVEAFYKKCIEQNKRWDKVNELL